MRSHRVTLLRRSIALRQVIASSQVRNGARRGSLQLPVGGNERLLGDVLGVLGRPERGERGPEDGAPVPLDELAEGLVVAGLRPANQVQVDGRIGVGGDRLGPGDGNLAGHQGQSRAHIVCRLGHAAQVGKRRLL